MIVILARGGSKGIPRKNLRRIHGQTLVARCITTCLEVAEVVVVSSDDEDILGEAARHGAIPLKRPDELSTDEANSLDGLRHARYAIGSTGRMALVNCTAPMVTTNDVRRCYEATECDMAVCCHRFHGFVLGEDGQCLNRTLTPEAPRRQDLSPQYLISGSCWAFDSTYLNGPFYSGSIRVVESEGPHCDIDTMDDLEQAERLLAGKQFVMPDLVWEHHHA